jgi:hypothetical protein
VQIWGPVSMIIDSESHGSGFLRGSRRANEDFSHMKLHT